MNRRQKFSAFKILAVLLALYFALYAEPSSAAARNPKWAVPIKLDGVPNLYRVDEHIYRSAQPTSLGMKNLEKMGIKTVVNLRSYNSDDDEISGTGLNEIRIKMHAWDPELRDVLAVLRVLTGRSGAPYLVHCQHGADRTGMTIALYRMVAQGWSREDAIDEMLNGDYGFHTIWTDIVEFLEEADIDAIRRAL